MLFDLVDLNLLEDFFQLDYQFYTTPQVISEITDEYQLNEIEKYINRNSLIVESSGILESILVIFDKYPGLSFTDSSVLELSIRLNGILLSSDKGLRNITRRNNLEVKGVLWIITELVNNKIITKETAVHKLKMYPDINLRAPVNEIKKLIISLQ